MIELKTEIPGPKSRELMAERVKHVARGPFHITPVFLREAKGALLEDVDGNRLIDFAAGIGVVNVGHAENSLVESVIDQSKKFLHASFNVTPYESYVRLAEKLNAATPGQFAKKSFFANSGAEAVENAIKIARTFTKRQGVICFEHAFHGRTYLAMALTHKEKPYKEGFGPFPTEVYSVLVENFEENIEAQVPPSNVAAVIVEPVMGEGGFIPIPALTLGLLRKFCDQNGIVLIADEIQTGFGRTGTLFACEQLGLIPDLLLSAKGLGGGMPISAVTGRAEIMDAPVEGGIGGTFGGNPVACAAALAVFDLFRDGSLLAHARTLGDRLRERLLQWKEKFPAIKDVRGLGPMQAIELQSADSAKKITRYALEHGVVVMTAGTYGNVVRFLFPLSIESSLLDEGLDVIESGLWLISSFS